MSRKRYHIRAGGDPTTASYHAGLAVVAVLGGSLLILTGLAVFAKHRYGSAAQASLFVVSYFAYPHLVTTGVFPLILLALSVAACVRMSRWAYKMLALSTGFALFIYLGFIVHLASHAAYLRVTAMAITIPIILFVGIPTAYKGRRAV